MFFFTAPAIVTESTKPNIVFIYADDLGYGDTSAYGATAVKTPNIDRLSKEGLLFTNAYATSATCTPSRYSLMTGRYAFRQKGTGVLPGDAALIIPTNRATLPGVLQRAGYVTGVVGKWHLGLGPGTTTLDWNKPIAPGPREVGFNYSFIMAATGDRVPCVYLENQRVVGLSPADPIQVSYKNPFPGEPTASDEIDHLKMRPSQGHDQAVVNGVPRIGYTTGGNSALWHDEDRADLFVEKGVKFLESHRKEPFFLYFATHDIHVPRVPHSRFVGKTKMGARGDVIVELDWTVGKILSTLDNLHLTSNTIVIVSSDNGPVLDDGYRDGAAQLVGQHRPAGPFRGGKYSIFEGGTRMPMIVRWPGHILPGKSQAMISQVDLLRSFAHLAGTKLTSSDAPDSFDVLAALLGKSSVGRNGLIEYAGTLAIRNGNWKLIRPSNGAAYDPYTAIELGNSRQVQLYDLSKDPGERTNIASEHPHLVARLTLELDRAVRDGQSHP